MQPARSPANQPASSPAPPLRTVDPVLCPCPYHNMKSKKKRRQNQTQKAPPTASTHHITSHKKQPLRTPRSHSKPLSPLHYHPLPGSLPSPVPCPSNKNGPAPFLGVPGPSPSASLTRLAARAKGVVLLGVAERALRRSGGGGARDFEGVMVMGFEDDVGSAVVEVVVEDVEGGGGWWRERWASSSVGMADVWDW